MRKHAGSVALEIVAAAMLLAAAPTLALAQAGVADPSQYFSHGADMWSVPADGAGAAFFSSGADTTSIAAGEQAGREYFANGAAVTGVPSAGEPGGGYFANGAETTAADATAGGANYSRDGADALAVPAAGRPGADYFASGAQATSVPAADQPGAEYFANGTALMSGLPMIGAGPRAAVTPATHQEAPPASSEPDAADAVDTMEAEPEAAADESEATTIEHDLQGEAPKAAASTAASSDAPAEMAAERANSAGTQASDRAEAGGSRAWVAPRAEEFVPPSHASADRIARILGASALVATTTPVLLSAVGLAAMLCLKRRPSRS